MIEASAFYRVSIAKYAAWELDQHQDGPKVYVGLLPLYEVCFIKRLRAGVPMQVIADALGHDSTTALHEMERGEVPCLQLALYLNERGIL